METRTIRLNFDLSFVYGPRTWRVPMTLAMLFAAVGELNSESVTLSTYYPAPSGVYTNMITTGDTYLARDGAINFTKVGIGTISPAQKLSVVGTASVTGMMGVGMSTPTLAMDVRGNINVQAAAGGAPGYIHLNATGCGAPQTVTSGAICAAGQYATFQPGVYVEGWSYQNHPSPFLVAPNGTTRIYRAWGTWGPNQVEMPIGVMESAIVVCCNK